MCSVSSQDGNRDHGATEENIEEQAEEGEESLAAEEECQDDSESGVDDGGARYALDCFHPCWNGGVSMTED